MDRRVGFWGAVALAVVLLVGSALAQGRVTVTANDLVQRNHVLGNQRAERTPAGFRAVFERAGEYRGTL